MRQFYVYLHCQKTKRKLINLAADGVNLELSGAPFYVGKGCGERAFDFKRNQGHGAILRELQSMSVPASDIVHFAARGLTEAKALELESKLIYFFGTRYEKDRKGLLVNLDVPPRPDFIRWDKWRKQQPKAAA